MNKILVKEKYFISLVWTAIFLVLFFCLQHIAAFHFFFMEQWQTFIYDGTFISTVLFQPGGFAQLIADFLVQFFYIPYCGALIFSLLLTFLAWLTGKLLKKLASQLYFPLLGLLPVISMMFLQLNINYQLSGTVAFLLCVTALYILTFFKSVKSQVIYSALAAFLLFLLAGPVALLFSISVFLFGLLLHFRYFYFFLIPTIITALLSVIAVHLGVAGEYKYLLLPDGYFSWIVQGGNIIYQPWLVFLVIFCTFLFLHYVKDVKKKLQVLWLVVQVVILGYFAYYIYSALYNSNDEFFKELSYYVRTEQWDKILQRTQDVDMKNYLYQNCRNLALAEKGELADKLFDYSQDGLQSIYLTDIASPYVSMLVGDIYFSMGHMALAQRRIFEANESTGNTCAYAFQRLIEISLAYGDYPIAEKYISFLEKTLFYKDWAHYYRRFLRNDKAVENDILLGSKRRCIFPENCFSGQFGIDSDLKHIIDHNPSYRISIQYLGAIYLLICDMENFRKMIERYYGTLALPVLPRAFQEGFVASVGNDSIVLKRYHISDEVIKSYQSFIHHEPVRENTYWNYLLNYRGN